MSSHWKNIAYGYSLTQSFTIPVKPLVFDLIILVKFWSVYITLSKQLLLRYFSPFSNGVIVKGLISPADLDLLPN